MRIGVDLDNTIICYDRLFHAVAAEKGWITSEIHPSKAEVKRVMMQLHGNELWTELQGLVYGPRLQEAEAYPGALEFFIHCAQAKTPLSVQIISHKTRNPAQGGPFDLHQAALTWLDSQGWFDKGRGTLDRSQVFFCETREEKVATIARESCGVFIDDLTEVLLHPAFPAGTRKVLFDPDAHHLDWVDSTRLNSWAEISKFIFNEVKGP